MAETEASTILCTSAAVSCPAVADWTAASTSARVTPGWAEAWTAASTIFWISMALVPSGTASETALDTDAFTESLTSFAISSADGPAGAAGSSLAQAISTMRTTETAASDTIFTVLLPKNIVNPPLFPEHLQFVYTNEPNLPYVDRRCQHGRGIHEGEPCRLKASLPPQLLDSLTAECHASPVQHRPRRGRRVKGDALCKPVEIQADVACLILGVETRELSKQVRNRFGMDATATVGKRGPAQPLQPSATFIFAGLCAVMPNVRIMEIDIDDVSWKDALAGC